MEEIQLFPPASTILAFEFFPPTQDDSGGNRRFFLRTETRIDARILCDAYHADCSVLDLSEGGARIRSFSAKVPPRQLSVEIPGVGTLAGRVVWRGKDQFGFQFRGTDRARSGPPLPDDQSPDDACVGPNRGFISPPHVVTDTVSLRGNRLQRLRKLAILQAT